MNHATMEPARDLAFEALVDAAATAKLTDDYTLFLFLEMGIQAREAGTLGQLVMEMERSRPSMPDDHPAVTANIRERVAAVLAQDKKGGDI